MLTQGERHMKVIAHKVSNYVPQPLVPFVLGVVSHKTRIPAPGAGIEPASSRLTGERLNRSAILE